MMALELKTRIRSEFAISFSFTQIVGETMNQIARDLIPLERSGLGVARVGTAIEPIDEMDAISEQRIDQLLSPLLARSEAAGGALQ